jgi:sulfate adenylyltransferase
VAKVISEVGGIAIVAAISPYDEARKLARKIVGEKFLLVHLTRDLDKLIEQDRKGLYAKALSGEIKNFTGISDPYEIPDDAELTVDTGELSVADSVSEIVTKMF